MRSKDPVVAIAVADIHLSLKPPVARAGESDWLEAMARPLTELRNLKAKYDVPVLCAGDVFDRWNAPAELINFALTHLPDMIAIPGQHDLPFHSMGDIKRSAYWTLVEAVKITMVHPGLNHIALPSLEIHGFPWGESITPCGDGARGRMNVALLHEYVWIADHAYPNAPQENHFTKNRKIYETYDVVITGDNHKGFQHGNLFNCGSLMRRKTDEIAYRPQVGLIHASGKIEPHYLDTSCDNIVAASDEQEARDAVDNMELKGFLDELAKLEDSALDFVDAMQNAIRKFKPSEAVRQILKQAMDKRKD